MESEGAIMTNSDFPILVLTILSFLAGFAAAIWLAIVFDHGAREIAEKDDVR
jgi:hypothetical protein